MFGKKLLRGKQFDSGIEGMQSSQWGKHPGRVPRGWHQESVFSCLLTSGQIRKKIQNKNGGGTVNLKAVRPLLRKGPQLLKAAPPVEG